MSKDNRREILGLSTITYKFQVTIPKKVRDRCKIMEGDAITFIEENGKVYLAKSTEL